MDVKNFSNIFGADLINKAYDDSLSGPSKQIGKIGVDFLKALRLFTAPIQLLASYQDRLEIYLKEVVNAVPPERQIQAPSSLSGPVLDNLKYLEENNPITKLYLALLSRSIDIERINEAHPAFLRIIEQLSPDEAVLLYFINLEPVVRESVIPVVDTKNGEQLYGEVIYIEDTAPLDKLIFPSHFNMYISHLESLSLISAYTLGKETLEEDAIPDNIRNGIYEKNIYYLTQFGSLFAKACVANENFFKV